MVDGLSGKPRCSVNLATGCPSTADGSSETAVSCPSIAVRSRDTAGAGLLCLRQLSPGSDLPFGYAVVIYRCG